MDLQRAQLAYDASLRALDQQQRMLEGIRARTGILLGAASLTASFLGARALDGGFVPLGVLALAALVVTLVAGTVVLVPRESTAFAISGTGALPRTRRGQRRGSTPLPRALA
jgi:hypothetical protein